MSRKLSLLEQVDISTLQSFVAQRLQEDGGFSATPMLPHTVMDTFCGVEILFALQGLTSGSQYQNLLAHEPTRQYLLCFADHPGTIPARIKYQLTVLLNHFHLSPDLLPLASCDGNSFRGFEELYYLSVLGEQDCASALEPRKHEFLSMQDNCVRECFFNLQWRLLTTSSSKKVTVKQHQDALVRWLEQSQGPDGGFGFFPGTTSFIENCDYALAALVMLDGCPADWDKAVQFVLSCQTGVGGFARSPMAAPFLDTSLHAVRALFSLEQMKN